MLYIILCSGLNYPGQVDKLRKLPRVFYMSSCFLNSFFELYIKLGASLLGKFSYKRCRKVKKKHGRFPGGSLLRSCFISNLCNVFQNLAFSY